MSCEALRLALPSQAEAPLSPTLLAHLAACPDCRAEAAAYRAARFGPHRFELPPGFWDGFSDALTARAEVLADDLALRVLRPARPPLPAGFWDGFTGALARRCDELADAPVDRVLAPARPSLSAHFWDGFTDTLARRCAEAPSPDRAFEPARPPLPAGFWDGFTPAVLARCDAAADDPADRLLAPRRPALPAHLWGAPRRPLTRVAGVLAAALLLGLLLRPAPRPVAPLAELHAPAVALPLPAALPPAWRVKVVRGFALDNSVRAQRARSEGALDVVRPPDHRGSRPDFPIERDSVPAVQVTRAAF